MKANLHMHSVYSDGRLPVSALVARMAEAGITHAALTDHDSVAGVPAFLKHCLEKKIEAIPAVELSSYPDAAVLPGFSPTLNLHILGYGIDPARIQPFLDDMETRKRRGLSALYAKLAENGYPVPEERKPTGLELRSRVGVAKALVAEGYAADVSAAFLEILNTPPYQKYCVYYRNPRETIAAIHAAGGYAVWAHPYYIKGTTQNLTLEQVETALKNLVSFGLDGVECCYAQFSEPEVNALRALAAKYNLMQTVGTDYHAVTKAEETLLDDGARIRRYTAACRESLEKLFAAEPAATGSQSDRLMQARRFAEEKHAGQTRKGSTVPYIVHPVAVMEFLKEEGADETTLIAALLHDTIEDTDTTYDEIAALFGAEVADLVAQESENKALTWKERKSQTVAHIQKASRAVQLIACADKLHNLTGILADREALGEAVWLLFSAPKAESVWYYTAIRDALSALEGVGIYERYKKLVEKIAQ